MKCFAGDGPVVGVITWEPGTHRDAKDYDKTDDWSGIAISPSTGKFGAACEWTNRALIANYKAGGKADGDLVSVEVQ